MFSYPNFSLLSLSCFIKNSLTSTFFFISTNPRWFYSRDLCGIKARRQVFELSEVFMFALDGLCFILYWLNQASSWTSFQGRILELTVEDSKDTQSAVSSASWNKMTSRYCGCGISQSLPVKNFQKINTFYIFLPSYFPTTLFFQSIFLFLHSFQPHVN